MSVELTFSYETVVKRWPIILTGILDHLHNMNHDLTLETQADTAHVSDLHSQIAESTAIIEKISRLKYLMGRDKELECVPRLSV
jgi:damage-control phosphatase, subfamily III